MIGRLLQQVRLALRRLSHTPVFTSVAVLSLSVGIGAATAVFGLVDAALLHPLAVTKAEELVTLKGSYSEADHRAILENTQAVFSTVAASHGGISGYVTTPVERVAARTYLVSGDYFETAGVRAHVGRLLSSEDNAPAATAWGAVVSHRFFERHLAADPSALGRAITVNEHAFVLVGVLPARFRGFGFGSQADVFVPLSAASRLGRKPKLAIVARRKPDVTVQQVELVLARISRAPLRLEEPIEVVATAEHAVPGRRPFQRFARSLAVGAGACLLIACINWVGLLLARVDERRKETAVRGALGASSGRIAGLLITESLLVSALSGVGALAVALAFHRLLGAFYLPGAVHAKDLDLRLDLGTLALSLAAAAAIGLLCAVVPALRAARADPSVALKPEGAQGGRKRSRTRELLMVGQVALCVPILVGAGLFLRSVAWAYSVDPGFDRDGVIRVQVPRPSDAEEAALLERLAADARRMPEIEAVDVSCAFGQCVDGIRTLLVDGSPRGVGDWCMYDAVGPAYFKTLRLRLRKGRVIDGRDVSGAPKVAVIEESLAALLWPGEDVLGRRFALPTRPGDPVEVVGVVEDAGHLEHLALKEAKHRPRFYVALAQGWPAPQRSLLARARGNDTDPAIAALARRLRDLDPLGPPPILQTATHAVGSWVQGQQLGSRILGLFGAIGLLLAATGLYGLLAGSVARRVPEIGVRIALGATRAQVVGVVLEMGARIVAAGLAIGTLLTLWSGPLIASFLLGVRPADPAVLVGAALLMTVVAGLACYIPARRAARIDPMRALRRE